MLFLTPSSRPNPRGKGWRSTGTEWASWPRREHPARTLTFLFYHLPVSDFLFRRLAGRQYLWDYDLGWTWCAPQDETLFIFSKTRSRPCAILKLTSVIMVHQHRRRPHQGVLTAQVFNFSNGMKARPHQSPRSFATRVLFIGLSIGLEFIGIGLETFAVLLGIVSIGIGFGAEIARRISSTFHHPVRAADQRATGDGQRLGRAGQDINVRVTKLRTQDNISVIIPQQQFHLEQVLNWTADHRVRLHLPVGVAAYGAADVKGGHILLEVAKTSLRALSPGRTGRVFQGSPTRPLNFDLLFGR
ncbi:MAG: mechanosensitive ion channel [Deltaproteobacteria bacterium]|nr:mechanosensitive ion channel [Deltaproteobacteria bacterium]